jgi:hypothetical protein
MAVVSVVTVDRRLCASVKIDGLPELLRPYDAR